MTSAGLIIFLAIITALCLGIALILRKKEFKIDSANKKIGGVCAGMAKKIGIKPNWIKLGFILMTIIFGYLGLCFYLACWLIWKKG